MTTTKAILLHDVLTDEEAAAIEAAVPRIPGFANATGSFSARRKVNSDWAGPLTDAIRQRYRTLAEPFTREGGFRFWGGKSRLAVHRASAVGACAGGRLSQGARSGRDEPRPGGTAGVRPRS